MFNLEKAIAGWRRQMLAAGIRTPVPLDELEGHLRDDISQQIRQGVETEQAFAGAVGRIGQPGALLPEFGKVGRTKRLAVRAINITVGIIFGSLATYLYRWEEYRALDLCCCLLGSVHLSLVARKQIALHKWDSKWIVRMVWAGQICLGLYGLLICSPYYPLNDVDPVLTLFVAQLFPYAIRRRSELRELRALRPRRVG